MVRTHKPPHQRVTRANPYLVETEEVTFALKVVGQVSIFAVFHDHHQRPCSSNITHAATSGQTAVRQLRSALQTSNQPVLTCVGAEDATETRDRESMTRFSLCPTGLVNITEDGPAPSKFHEHRYLNVTKYSFSLLPHPDCSNRQATLHTQTARPLPSLPQ